MIKLLIVMFLCGISVALNDDQSDPVVCYSMGCVRGKNYVGNIKPYEGFFGIPYVKQPVGDLRLKDPQPITEKFTEIYNATEEKMFCAQKNYLLPNPSVIGVEDCLYLYVYRPKNWQRKNKKPLPILIYIHGGAFFAGIAGPSVTGGDYIMDTEDVIFVTMSYRLGPLGFLSTGDENISGNFGLKDQAMAIKWVKDNIYAFGGDPNNIALMGQSAGAASVHLHMMSPWSCRNFHKAIILSGNGIAPYAYVLKDPFQQARKYAIASGMKLTSEMTKQDLANYLRNVDTKTLLDATDSFKIWSIDPLVISRPVVEDCSKVHGFLCEDPVKMWRNGIHSHIPLITGYMDGDGGVRSLQYFENQELLEELNNNLDGLMPKLLEIVDPLSENVTTNRWKQVKDRYFNGQNKLEPNQWKNLMKLYTDRSFVTPMADTLLQLVKSESKSPAYLYKFNFRGPLSNSILYTGTTKDFGTVHSDELIYLLKSPLLFPQQYDANSREGIFRSRFVKFFTYFAINGKPPKANNKTLHRCIKNEAFAVGTRQLKCSYIDFDEKISIKAEGAIDNDAVDFWNQIDTTLVK
ncbi:hypothetical protein PVAND_015400 [Polypedilum vanderplanki]|uniref:Carboxylic ester hydrolase n=1 Tax=Polypedilum vanderplanki TaxID=319348 RepID=A0A9J6BD00_POLVA|nr:hypothetical protein PVAND_015400 [Polypedilum vanderplanki]